jgi:hypothetical protein
MMVEIPPLPTSQEQSSHRRRLGLEFVTIAVMSVVTLAGLALTYLRG